MNIIETIKLDLGADSYDIVLGHDLLLGVGQLCNLQRKVLIVTDTGVPEEYAERLLAQCKEAYIWVVAAGEQSKTIATWQQILEVLLQHNFSRKDLVIALGGGMIGDLAGFAAATYMRGLDFVNIPTTTLSQIDSSIGGKTAVDLNGVKNIVGAFYQPKITIIDFELLETLPQRQYNSGLVEAIKAGLIADADLFERFEKLNPQDLPTELPHLISSAIKVKQQVVEQDEKEQDLRQILNFGHTLGHGLESYFELNQLLHGEAVGLGMLMITTDPQLRLRIANVLQKFKLPTAVEYDSNQVFELISHDKKAVGDMIDLVEVKQPGKAERVKVPLSEIRRYL